MKEPWDYTEKDKLSKILNDKRLSTKYGGRYGKYLEIFCGYGAKGGYKYWKIDRAGLEFLLYKYGDIKFKDAIEKWEAE